MRLLVRRDETEFEVEAELVERQEALEGCLGKLPENDRDLIHRRYAEGATTRGVAEQVGRSADAVYKALSRIRRALHACVSGGASGGGA